jgi:GTP cyclohydrolase I
MSRVEMPIKLSIPTLGSTVVPAEADVYVNLNDPKSKGIHMSRLYLELQDRLVNNELSMKSLKGLLENFVTAQDGISNKSQLKLNFKLPVSRKALISDLRGWRQYPVWLKASFDKKENKFKFILGGEILYSSTCPCSAALSRKMVQDLFSEKFNKDSVDFNEVYEWLGDEKASSVTPHAQRSSAHFKVLVNHQNTDSIDWLRYIDAIEGALKTPVQAAVKREDEQEFARLNGQNLMFCEDAARRIKKVLDQETDVLDYKVRVNHKESLHPHDATAIVSKN